LPFTVSSKFSLLSSIVAMPDLSRNGCSVL
jgi:hypothetical protein